MTAANIAAYLRMEQLPEMKNVKQKGAIRSRKHPRYDLTAIAGYWGALEGLKNYKGILYLTMIASDKNVHRKQEGTTPEYYLQCTPAKSGSINFSGIRFEHGDGKETLFASGEPCAEQKLKGGGINPMYGQRNDAFLFIFSGDMQCLEILVIDGGRVLVDAYRKQLSVGGMDDVLDGLRKQAKTPNSL
jgi:hypothetical protein